MKPGRLPTRNARTEKWFHGQDYGAPRPNLSGYGGKSWQGFGRFWQVRGRIWQGAGKDLARCWQGSGKVDVVGLQGWQRFWQDFAFF
jgi:hypothetical protein